VTPEKIAAFQQQLQDWYRVNQRPLPWRLSRDPYRIWVSEVMLQQTQVNTVIPYYHRFMARFPDIVTFSASALQDVLKCWEGLGYYARARNLHKAAGIVVSRFEGQVPDNWKEFTALPGVGPYIGAAVLSIAHDRVLAVVDGNVKRVLARIFEDPTPVNGSTAHKSFSRLADTLIDPASPGNYNQGLMEVGALVCKPTNPRCGQCPVGDFCLAHRHGSVADYPRRNKRKPVPEIRVAVGVVRRNGTVLITQRKLNGLLGGLWEFPGGKIEKGETAKAACRREIKEEVGLDIRVDTHLTQVRHAYTHFKIVMDVFLCDHIKGTVQLHGPVDHCWIDMADIDQYPIPKANLKFISKLKNPEILNG
jgi:A/G-specific adenine glycosylase